MNTISKYKQIKKDLTEDNFVIFNTLETPDRDFIRFSFKKSQLDYLIYIAKKHNVAYRSGTVLTTFFEILLSKNNKENVVQFLDELLNDDYLRYKEFKNNYKKYKDDLLEFEELLYEFLTLINADHFKRFIKSSNPTNFEKLYKSPKSQYTRAIKKLDKFYK